MAGERINKVLYDLVKAKGTNESVAKPLGVTPQALGRYMKNRVPPVSFILRWKEVYKEDLLALSEPDNEPIVSRETKSGSSKHKIVDGDYVGMHKDAWAQFEKTLVHSRKVLTSIAKNNSTLANNNSELIKELVRILPKTGSDKQ